MATIKLSHDYPVSKEKIWEYLTNDDLLTSWCLPSKIFLLEKGKEFIFQSDPSIFWDGLFKNTILDFSMNTFLSYKCVNENSKLDTVVTWKIIEENNSVKLSLEHSGFRPIKDFFTKVALTGGWKNMMQQKLYNKLIENR